MMMLKICAYSFVLLVSSLLPVVASAQSATPADTSQTQPVRGIQYTSREAAAAALEAARPVPFFAGVAVSADLCGAFMAAFTPYGQYEAAARINLWGRYFPTVEVGIGSSNHTNETTELHYKVNAPYFRIGCDYNFLKNRRSGNRLFAGARYAFTTFTYDIDGPDLVDPIYGTTTPYRFTNLRGRNHWGEILFGLEAKVLGPLHLGWTVRYRIRFSDRQSSVGSPWYVPGYGKNDTHALGGTFNLVIDI